MIKEVGEEGELEEEEEKEEEEKEVVTKWRGSFDL